MKCYKCGRIMKKCTAKTPENVEYDYFQCTCGEEIVSREQLHNVAQKYRVLKHYQVKLSKSIGSLITLRIMMSHQG